jgi:hypothetical protein
VKKLLSKAEFINKARNIRAPVYSKTGRASYSKFNVAGNMLEFRRDEKNTLWVLMTISDHPPTPISE